MCSESFTQLIIIFPPTFLLKFMLGCVEVLFEKVIYFEMYVINVKSSKLWATCSIGNQYCSFYKTPSDTERKDVSISS